MNRYFEFLDIGRLVWGEVTLRKRLMSNFSLSPSEARGVMTEWRQRVVGFYIGKKPEAVPDRVWGFLVRLFEAGVVPADDPNGYVVRFISVLYGVEKEVALGLVREALSSLE